MTGLEKSLKILSDRFATFYDVEQGLAQIKTFSYVANDDTTAVSEKAGISAVGLAFELHHRTWPYVPCSGISKFWCGAIGAEPLMPGQRRCTRCWILQSNPMDYNLMNAMYTCKDQWLEMKKLSDLLAFNRSKARLRWGRGSGEKAALASSDRASSD